MAFRNGSTVSAPTRTMQVARLFRVIRTDGQEHLLTDHDRPVRYRGRKYEPEPGVNAHPIRNESGLRPRTSRIGILIDQETGVGPTFDDVRNGRLDAATIHESWVDWRFPDGGGRWFGIWQVRDPEPGELEWQADLVRWTELLDRKIGTVIEPNCGNELGVNDGVRSFCGLDLAPFTKPNVQVTQVTNRRVFTLFAATGSIHVADYYAEGRVTWLTGPNAGSKEKIAASSANFGGFVTITLAIPAEELPQTGDRVDLIAGCNHSPDHCQNKFDAYHLYFRGHPYVPGTDKLINP